MENAGKDKLVEDVNTEKIVATATEKTEQNTDNITEQKAVKTTEKPQQEKSQQKNTAQEKDTKSKGDKTEKSASEKYQYLIKNREIKKHSKKHKIAIILMIFLGTSLILGGSVFAMLSYLNYNNFLVLIDKEGMNIFSLSNSYDFSSPSQVLSLSGPKYMDNITLMDIYSKIPDMELAEGTYGSNLNNKYTAATFYLKNVSGKDQIYRESIILDDISKNVDEAIRIMVIKNGERTVYAKAKADGTPEEVVPGQSFTKDGGSTEIWFSEPFISPKHAFYNTGLTLAQGEIVKYTVLIWLEGWDEQCVDSILGGTIKIEFQFSQQNEA